MKALLPAASLVLLAACATAGPGSSGRIDWACDGGAAFSLRYTAQGEADVFAGGQTYLLAPAQTGSGARYADGLVEYREHQGQATLNGAAGGPYANCRRR